MTDRQVEEMVKLWSAYYQSRNVSPEFSKQCLDYARPLFKRDIPVIFDFQHLCLLLGLEAEYLQSVIYGAKNITENLPSEKEAVEYVFFLPHTIP